MSEKVPVSAFNNSIEESLRLFIEAQFVAVEEGFNASIPLDENSDEAVAQVMRLGLARHVDEARYLLFLGRGQWDLMIENLYNDSLG